MRHYIQSPNSVEKNNMPKTKFSKSELLNIHRILVHENMFPLSKIGIDFDGFNSGFRSNYYLLRFLHKDKQLTLGFITKNLAKPDSLKEQLSLIYNTNQNN